MAELSVDMLVHRLGLARHPEGGWFRECYRSPDAAPATGLPERFAGPRSFCTSIYFLLERGDFSCLHRIKSDELWHFYAGTSLTVHILTPEGVHSKLLLGADLSHGETFQGVAPAGCWFGAELSGEGEYALVGCTVSPGFDFADFEMAQREDLLREFPIHAELITRLTRGG